MTGNKDLWIWGVFIHVVTSPSNIKIQMKITLSILTLFIAALCNAQTIETTEAVEYDSVNNQFIISNSTSILKQASGSDELEFFGDSDADYGMEVIGNTLVTISGGFGQSVKFHDLTTEEELNSITISGSGFLNGMASDPAGNRIWVTDFSANDIIEIDVTDVENPTYETVVSNTGCTPNGITYDADNNRLVFVCWTGGDVVEVDLEDYSLTTLIDTGLSNIDGIDHDEDGNFYISSWSPTRITKLSSDFTVEETVTASGLSSPADISYAVEIDTLAVANSGNSSITYIYFGEPDFVLETEVDGFEVSVYPNPVTEESYLEFDLDSSEKCEINILDAQGKLVHQLLNENLSAGNHKVLLAGLLLKSGNYICEVKTEKVSTTVRLNVN